jgi:hypothetical protein
MKFARYGLVMVGLFAAACHSKVNEVTAPAQPPPAPEGVGWHRAPTRTPTPATTPTPMQTSTPTQTPTRTPTPPFNLTGRWYGTFTSVGCIEVGVEVTIFQTGTLVWGFFPDSCFPGPPNGDLEIDGTLQGSTLVVTLWDGDIVLGSLTGLASPTAFSVWNPDHTLGLAAER